MLDTEFVINPATRMGHVHLHMADLDGANGFYHELLGFELQGVSRSVGASFVSAGGYHHHIGLNIWLGQGAPAPALNSLGLRYFTIELPDRSELKRLKDRLSGSDVAIKEIDSAQLVRDPFLNGVRLAAPSNSER
jgi:catechol 2,3-dioxygenase